MLTLDTLDPRSLSSDIHTWMEQVSRLCGRYRAIHALPSIQWAIENHAATDCIRMVTNCDQMTRSQADARRDTQDFYFLVLQLNGLADMTQGERTVRLSPGDLVLIDSTCSSNFHFGIKGTLSDQVSLILPRERLSVVFEGRAPRTAAAIAATSFNAGMLGTLVGQLYMNASPSEAHHDALIDATLSLLRPELGLEEIQPLELLKASKDKLLRRAVAIIDANLSNPDFKAQDIALQMGTSLRNLHRVFARHSTTPGRFIIDQRLHLSAARLRQAPHLSISNIAFDCGFVDLSHFSKAFRRYFGVTARAFRSQLLIK
ncbi:helix-turn-helix domain-containing protein [Pseudomonas sp. NPDC008258]|uniref:helix-turn-helix domain-containing protein n=1 Tax=Pseudomonas sp. NPDC008258 TaxID=3364418 RepID=UPI0036E98D66